MMRPRSRFWLLCLAIFVGLESLDRVTLALWVGLSDRPAIPSLFAAVPLGIIEDLGMALVLGGPFLAGLVALAPLWRRRGFAIAAHALLLVLLVGVCFEQLADLVFWNEFDSRFNSIAVNYVMFPREVIGNIRQSFSPWLLLPSAIGGVALYGLLFRSYRAALAAPDFPGDARRAWLVAPLAMALGWGLAVWEPRWGVEGRIAGEIAANGIKSLASAALTDDQAYDGIYLGMDDARARRLVREMVAQDNARFLDPAPSGDLRRQVTQAKKPLRPLNLVLVFEESFGSVYVDSLDNASGESIAPELERLAKGGLLFENIYATGNRTVRALEAILTSFPPIPGIATSRRLASAGMHALPAVLADKGYATAFLYGGRGLFDNMGAFWRGIGFGQVWDQGDIVKPGFTTIWGVADEYLFDEALARLDRLSAGGKPFFLGLLTVSNHRPYTYPEGRIAKDPAQKRRQNAASYADWAFGRFVEQARAKPWFADTLFVFVGDHGPRVYGAGVVPVPSYRVPLLVYAPAHIPPERNAVLGSSLDVAPTLLGLMGIDYESPFFGVDLKHVPTGGGRVVMEHNYSIALGDGASVAAIGPGQRATGYAMRPGPHDLTPAPAADAETLERVVALTQTAHRLFNARRYHRAP